MKARMKKRTVIKIMSVLALLLFFVPYVEAVEVDIPDPGLEAAIREALFLLGPITDNDLATLTFLDASEREIADLTGLEYCVKLCDLYLYGNHVSDLYPLGRLHYLRTLNLGYNNISDINPLSRLTKLVNLALGYNNISHIDPLRELTRLRNLDLRDNNISDIPWFGDLDLLRLSYLNLSHNQISDIMGLTELRLEELDLSSNYISNIQALIDDLGGNRSVWLRDNPLSYEAIYKQIPHLIDSGVHVDFDFRMPATLLKSSGDDQEGLTLATLPSPFVVLVLDQNGDPFEGIPVTFSVFWGGGSLDMKNTATDAGGLAQATLTLGPNPGKNRVEVTATGIPTTVTFTAIGLGANTILPVSFWPGDGHANDTVGENHGTLTNGATFAPGLVNQAFSFDGSDDYVVVPAPGSPSLEITDAITIQAWIYPTEIKRQHIVRKTGSAFEAPYDLFLSADNYIAFTLNVNGEWTQCLKSSYPINAWTHVAGTFDGSTMNLYVDGTLEDSLTSEGVLNTLGGPLLIGTRLGLPADTFNGLIDEVGIYNGAMDADDIRDIWLAHSVEENTLVGNDVVVKPVDPVTGTQPVTVTFGQVTADGMTTVTTTDTGPTPPTGFYLAGTHYDLATTASYTGSVTVCIEYDDSGMTEAEENTLKLYHFENEAWVDVTVPPVDTENNIICGQADSFSPFAVFVAEDTTPPTIVDVSVSPNVLWPANHKMVEVTVEVDAEDNSGRPPLCMIVNVESNELITSPGPGSDNSELDWSFTDDPLVVLLRAERAGGADRRIYTICLGCMDASGNTTTATVNVTVPRDMRKIKKK